MGLSPFDDRALRGGVLERCAEAGIAVIAHSPLGGPKRAGRLARNGALAAVADALDASPAEVALAWLLGLSPVVVAIPGARRPETARSAAAAAGLRLDAEQRVAVGRALGLSDPARAKRSRAAASADVVIVMGIPGAGKSRIADEHVARGYLRLNRDERGGSLRDVAGALDDALAAGTRQVVLDNTYLTRAARNEVVEIAGRHGASARCIWLDTPLAQAQINLVERLLDRCGSLPDPATLRELARREPGLLTPTSQMRTVRELEPPADDEGFASVERRAFARAPNPEGTVAGVFVAAAALHRDGWEHALAGTKAGRAAPGLRLEPGRRPHRARRRDPPSCRGGLGADRGRALPARRRAAALLVPAAASGPSARVRAGPRRRPVPLGARRHRARAPVARGGARRVSGHGPVGSPA